MIFGPVVQEETSFKDMSYLELWQPLCSVDCHYLCSFGRMYHEEQSCEIILNLDQWFRRKSRFNVVLIWSSVSPFVGILTFMSIYKHDKFHAQLS